MSIGLPRWLSDKESAKAGNAVGMSLIPGSGRSRGGGKGNPLQYSCLENPMDRGVWWAIAHTVSKNHAHMRICVHTHTHKHIQRNITQT